MSDYKGKYVTNSSILRKKAIKSKAYKRIRENALKRVSKYKKLWKYANINDIVNKYTPNAFSYTSGGKIIFSNNGRFNIVCDGFGSYFRIYDTIKKDYMTIDGIYRKSIPKNDREMLTHYNITKRKK